MTAIGYVIQPGEDIPDDVIELLDRTGDTWRLQPDGLWDCFVNDSDEPVGGSYEDINADLLRAKYTLLAVTAVREQPAEPEDVHYYFTELRTGLTYCGVDALEEDGVSTTSESGKATCTACLIAAGEDPPGARDADGFLRLKGTATGDNQLDPEPVAVIAHFNGREQLLDGVLAQPEPQQADASPVLDLVRQYGDERERFISCVGCGTLDESRAHERAAKELLARIAALVPQQPVQARDDLKRPLWQHDCAAITAFADPPKNGIDCTWCTQIDGRWLPLLVGGDPAPKAADRTADAALAVEIGNVAFVMERLGLATMNLNSARRRITGDYVNPGRKLDPLPPLDDALSQIDRARRSLTADPAPGRPAVVEAWKVALAERDEARAEVESLKAAIGGAYWQPAKPDDTPGALVPGEADEPPLIDLVTERKQARAEAAAWQREAERLKADVKVFTDVFGAKPDPLVLSLPEVPEGTEALVGVRSGVRYSYDSERDEWSYEQEDTTSRWYTNYQAILNKEHPDGVRVELAPPREPRTWPKLDGAPDGVEAVRGASGMVYRLRSGQWHAEDDSALCDSLPSVQNYDGPLTEVTE